MANALQASARLLPLAPENLNVKKSQKITPSRQGPHWAVYQRGTGAWPLLFSRTRLGRESRFNCSDFDSVLIIIFLLLVINEMYWTTEEGFLWEHTWSVFFPAKNQSQGCLSWILLKSLKFFSWSTCVFLLTLSSSCSSSFWVSWMQFADQLPFKAFLYVFISTTIYLLTAVSFVPTLYLNSMG